jgi:hypothetical protein
MQRKQHFPDELYAKASIAELAQLSMALQSGTSAVKMNYRMKFPGARIVNDYRGPGHMPITCSMELNRYTPGDVRRIDMNLKCLPPDIALRICKLLAKHKGTGK